MVFESVANFEAGKIDARQLRERIDVLCQSVVEMALTTPEEKWTPAQQLHAEKAREECAALELCWDKYRADLAAKLTP